MDGEEASSIKKELSAKSTVSYGIKYTLTLSGWEQSSLQDSKKFLEWSGTTKIKIASGTLRDLPQQDLPDTAKRYNTSQEQTFTFGALFVSLILPSATSIETVPLHSE